MYVLQNGNENSFRRAEWVRSFFIFTSIFRVFLTIYSLILREFHPSGHGKLQKISSERSWQQDKEQGQEV